MLQRGADGDLAFSQIAKGTGSNVALSPDAMCLQVPGITHDTAWWCECIDFLEELERTAEWYVQLHRVLEVFPKALADKSTTCLVVQSLGESKQWWAGTSSVARAAQAPVSNDSESEKEIEDSAATSPEEAVGVEHGDDGQSAGDHSDSDNAEDHSFLGGYAPRRLARLCKRSTAGTRESCVACRAGGREVLTYLLTYKEGRPGGKASYQILCDYHEPDILERRDGRSYRLPCRKTRTVENDSLESEYEAIRFLVRWVRRGPCFPGSRQGHQDMQQGDFEDVSRTSEDEDASPDCSSDRAKVGSGEQTFKAFSGIAPSHVVASGIAHSHVVAPEPCWVCGDRHELQKCPLWQLALQESMLANRHGLRPLGIVSRSGVVIPSNLFGCKDVPSDGDCLFHAVGREIAQRFRGHALLPGPDAQAGSSWRIWLLQYVRTTGDEIDGSSVAEWVAVVTGKTVEQYTEIMGVAGGRETWGGFLEVALMMHAWGRTIGQFVGCVLFGLEDRSARLLSWAGSRTAEDQIAIIWSGNHWLRLRMMPEGWKRVREGEGM